MTNVTPPEVPSGWATLIAALFGAAAIARVWGPLAGWIARRLDLAGQAHQAELLNCRQEIARLREQFEQYRTQADQTILTLSIKVAQLEAVLAEREADVAELRRALEERRG